MAEPDPTVPFGRRQFENQEQAAVQRLLEAKLPSEHISTRSGPGGAPVSYLESWKAIELANAVFGFNGWSSEVVSISGDYSEPEPKGDRWRVGVTAIVKVTLKDGTSHEDVGYGSHENKSKATAIENAKKEAVSDARKRALRVFGNALGNSVYDKVHTVHEVKSKPGLAAADITSALESASVPSTTASTTTPSTKPEVVAATTAPLTTEHAPQISPANASYKPAAPAVTPAPSSTVPVGIHNASAASPSPSNVFKSHSTKPIENSPFIKTLPSSVSAPPMAATPIAPKPEVYYGDDFIDYEAVVQMDRKAAMHQQQKNNALADMALLNATGQPSPSHPDQAGSMPTLPAQPTVPPSSTPTTFTSSPQAAAITSVSSKPSSQFSSPHRSPQMFLTDAEKAAQYSEMMNGLEEFLEV